MSVRATPANGDPITSPVTAWNSASSQGLMLRSVNRRDPPI